MSLKTCKHCGGEVAKSVVTCPHCGGKLVREQLQFGRKSVLSFFDQNRKR